MTSGFKGNHRNLSARAELDSCGSAKLHRAVGSVLEQLEDRRLLSAGSATLTNGELDIVGGQASNKISINLNVNDNSQLEVSVNGVTSSFKVADVKLIVATGGSGNDSITTQNNDLSITTPMKIYGGDGNNYLVGGDGPDTIYGGSGIDKIVGGVTKNKIDGGGGGDLINTLGAPSVIARHRHQQQLNAAGASLSVTEKHRRYIKNGKQKSTVRPIVEATGPAIDGAYTPTQLKHAYGIDQLTAANDQYPLYTNTGIGETIVIVGGYVSPFFDNIVIPGDIQAFDAAFGLSPANITYVQASGQTLQHDPSAELESALDIEYAHAFAPDAAIIMVQVDASNGAFFGSDLYLGAVEAANQANLAGGGVVSMSFGTSAEDPVLQATFDALFGAKSNRGISWIAAAGDNPGDVSTPATSPFVTAVGGTVLQADTAGNIVSQTAWQFGGGGTSVLEPIPAFQQGLTINGRAVGSKRMVPDISLVAEARLGAVKVYTGASPTTPSAPVAVSGTSIGAPIFAGMIADANELRATQRQAPIGSTLNTQIYSLFKHNGYGTPNGNFNDILVGNNTHQAYHGYDLATGLGTPQAQNLIPALAGIEVSDVEFVLHGQQIANLSLGGIVGNGITVVPGVGVARIGPLTISLTLNPNAVAVNGVPLLSVTVVVNRNLDNTFFGQASVPLSTTTTSATGTVTTTTSTYFVQITGKVTTGRNGREHITGTVETIDPNTGKVIHQGSQSVFTATFTG